MIKKSESLKSFDHIAKIYDETRAAPDTIIKEFYKKLENHGINFNNTIILDGGIGTGRTILPLLEYDITLIGLDNSIEMINRLKNKNYENKNIKKLTLLLGDITNIPFKESTFDLVILIQVFHLIKNRKKVINEIKRVLKPNGLLIIGDLTTSAFASKAYKKYKRLILKYIMSERIKSLLSNLLYIMNKSRYTRNIAKPFLKTYDSEFYLNNLMSSIVKDEIIWTEDIKTYDIFEQLDNRNFSFQWKIPIKKHKKIMLDLKKWIDNKENYVPSQEKISRHFNIKIIHFGEIHENK